MNGTIEADVDGKSTDCRCCGRQLELKHTTVCGQCESAGCNPDSRFCMAPDVGEA